MFLCFSGTTAAVAVGTAGADCIDEAIAATELVCVGSAAESPSAEGDEVTGAGAAGEGAMPDRGAEELAAVGVADETGPCRRLAVGGPCGAVGGVGLRGGTGDVGATGGSVTGGVHPSRPFGSGRSVAVRANLLAVLRPAPVVAGVP